MPENEAAEGQPLPPTHVYAHPESTGLGQHHAPGDLSTRPADPGVPLEHLMPEHRVSMADLDLQHGTEVAVVGTDESNGHTIFEWTDSQGTRRRTAYPPDVFAEFFVEAGA
jgi:hypothetical protein